MYSVIIQTKEAMDVFSSYRTLFSDAVHQGKVGFCTWNKSGRDIDEALPDIRELTDDKKEWCAVIINTSFTAYDLQNEKRQNPFDYYSNDKEDELAESNNALVRLTHMLGGIPNIEKQFRSSIIQEPFKEPRVIYEPVEDKERELAFSKLKEKYEFDGVLPTSIILISPRIPWKNEEDTSGSWENHNESKSSEFWKRNRYPSICRFLVFDFVKQGPVRKEADMFRFWLTVMLIASNKIDSSSMQAYRLYNANTEIDKEAMEDSFQIAINRISSAKGVIKSELKKESRGYSNADNKLPDYSIDIPVVFDLPKNAKCVVKPGQFHMISHNQAADIANWNSEKRHAEESLIKSIRVADRALDQTANRMKDSYTYDESEVMRMDRYQREDLELETDLLYEEIIDVQGKLPTSRLQTDAEAEEKAENVRKYMRGRITSGPIVHTFIAGTLMFIAAQIPALVQYFIGEPISWALIGLEVLTFIAVMLVCGFATLFAQKKYLDILIKEFNKKMQGTFNKLQLNASEYSKYLSAVASHSRGRSYLDISERKNKNEVSARNLRYKHISAIDLFLSKLQTWGEAFHLDVDYERPEINDEVVVDVMTPPIDNLMYSLEYGHNYDIEVNKSGMKIQTPFAFISRLDLVREELYDDDSL